MQDVKIFIYNQHSKKTALLLREFCLPSTTVVEQAPENAGNISYGCNNYIAVRDASGALRVGMQAVAYILKQSFILFPFGWIVAFVGSDQATPMNKKCAYTLEFFDHIFPWRAENPPGILAQTLCAVLVLCALASNIIQTPLPYFIQNGHALNPLPYTQAGRQILDIAGLLQVKQKWNLFAPVPSHGQLRPVFMAHSHDGSLRDYAADMPQKFLWLGYDSPNAWERYFWMQYTVRLAAPTAKLERIAFSKFLCRRENAGRDQDDARIQSIDIQFYHLPYDAVWPLPADHTETPSINENYTCPQPKQAVRP